ncbi:MAG: AraC family transcriptional regulator [Saccharospirillum sp.]|uniref:helix-turn-helix transcriptional regulator n=1 Tax=Saccharospirillum TaxID=231683 RepID=UPI00329A5ADD
MTHVNALLALMQFKTDGKHYQSRIIQPGREEIELVLDGQAVCQVEGGCYTVGPGHLVWHRSGDRTIFSNARSDDYECLVLAFATDPVNKPPLSRVSYWHSRISPRQFCDDALGYYDQARSAHSTPGQPIPIDAEFCQYLYGCCKVHSQPVDTGASLPDRSLHRALSYIADHYSKPITVDAIAAASHVSASQLYSLFRAQLGKTPHQSLLQYRMEKAVQLLIHQRPLKQVVNACGFESESGFIRAFKKRYGIPPGEYVRDGAVV